MYESLFAANGSETPLELGNGHWVEITTGIDVDGMPAYFDLKLSRALAEENRMFRLAWVDFCR